MRVLKLFSVAVVAASLVACGGGGENNTASLSTPSTGVFLDSAVSGIGYKTATQSGTTNSKGEFSYLSGETVTFFVGGLELPSVEAKATVTPLDIAKTTDVNDATASNILVLLQSLDEDGNPSNGIAIPSTAAAKATAGVDFNVSPSVFANDLKVISLIANSGSVTKSPVSSTLAIQHFQTTLAKIDNYYAPLISVIDELFGENCEFGGERILIGLDRNRNAVLDSDEITGTQYRCNASIPDVIPPKITTTAPDVATSSRISFTTTFTDDIELSAVRLLNGSTQWFDAAVISKELDESVYVALGGSYTGTYIAADMSGNIAKKKITITAPMPRLKIGVYKLSSEYTLPEGFDCLKSDGLTLPNPITQDGQKITTISISDGIGLYGSSSGYSYSGWSSVNGWAPKVNVIAGARSIGGIANNLTTLDGATFDFSSDGDSVSSCCGVGSYSYTTSYSGQVSVNDSDANILNISAQKNCNINQSGNVSGVVANFSAEYMVTPVATASAATTTTAIDTNIQLYGTVATNSTQDKTYQWTIKKPEGSSATLSSTSTSNPTFTPDVAGSYIATLVVNDGVADSEPVTVTVTASEPVVGVIGVSGITN